MGIMSSCVDCGATTKGYSDRCRSCAGRARWRTPEFREIMRNSCHTEEANARRSETMRAHWRESSELWDESMMAVREGYLRWLDSGGRKHKSDVSRKQWEDEGFRRRMLDIFNAKEELQRRSCRGGPRLAGS